MERIWIVPIITSILILGTLGFSQDAYATDTGPIGEFHIEVPCDNFANCTPLADLDAFDLDNQSYGTTSTAGVDVRTGVFPEVPLAGGLDFLGYKKLVGLNGATLANLGEGGTLSCADTQTLTLTSIIDTSNNIGQFPSGMTYAVLTADGNLFLLTLINIDATAPNGLRLSYEILDCDVPIGGTFIPIDQSALLLAGVQSISMWMIPVVIAGIGIFVIKRRN